MFELLSKNRCGPIGLDIGSGSVRMLQLATMRGKPVVVAAARWDFPETAIGPEADFQTRCHLAGQSVRGILNKGDFRGRNVISCLRSDEMSIKNIRLPNMPDDDLAGAIVWECRERFGFEVTPDRVHCIRAGEVRQGSETRSEIVLMAVPEESLRRHVDMLAEMHLAPLHIDAEPTAIFRAYRRFLRRHEDNSTVTVIVDIGLAKTDVIVARGRTILLVKTINLAGKQFNESVARELNMSYGEAAGLRKRNIRSQPSASLAAERLIISDAQTPHDSTTRRPAADAPAANISADASEKVEWSVFDAIREQVETLAREISLCLRYCSVTFRGLRPDTITLAGAEAYDPHLIGSLNEHLDCKCVVGQPLSGIDLGVADFGTDRRCELTEWSVVTGLALRGLGIESGAPRPTGMDRRVSAKEPVSVPAGADVGQGGGSC